MNGSILAAVLGIASMTPRALGAQTIAAPTDTARGTFEVTLTPQPTDAAPIGRMSIAKTFAGGLAGTSTGEMLMFQSAVDGSAGYVAMEIVTATLAGKNGTFVLQHSGTMARGAQHLDLTVVPDSGTGELGSISGTMSIRIEEGRHFYSFAYALD